MEPDDREPTSSWWLERLAQDELDAEAAALVRRRLAAEGRSVDEALAAIRASDRRILEALPPARVAEVVRRRMAATPRPAAWPARTLAALGAAAALLLVLRVGVTPPVPELEPIEVTRAKGSGAVAPRLAVYRHAPGGDERLEPGAAAAPGDLLQLAYRAAEPHGVLVSLDGAGNVTLHMPDPGAPTAAPLRTGAEVRLGAAYELDDAPGFERFVLVTAATPFEVAAVVEAARGLAADPRRARDAALPLPSALRQASLLLDKRGTP